jgi:aminoglycoside 3-N-acetyltransferase
VLEKDLADLGVVRGGVLLVHTSFRAVRAESPLRLIEALRSVLGPNGTLVMPTMTDGETEFDPRTTPTADMGITAETFWRLPGVLRSTHPGGSFAAVGPHAERICAPQPLSPPHGPDSPPGRVLELDGQVLLLGVTHSESTILHVAEAIAGVPYSIEHPCVVEGRRVMIAETDHCCRGFRKLDAWMSFQRGKVGRADAILGRARDIVDTAVKHLREDPLVFLCQDGCEECALARASVKK